MNIFAKLSLVPLALVEALFVGVAMAVVCFVEFCKNDYIPFSKER